MSIYFQTTPAGISEKTTPARGVGATHQNEPLFAFASSPGGRLLVCNDEGDTVHEVVNSSSPSAPSSMAFHPSRAIFAVGYRNGSFLLSGCGVENTNTNSALAHLDQREQPQIHQGSQINAVAFGTSLVDEMSSATTNGNNNTNINNTTGNNTTESAAGNPSTGDTIYFATNDKVLSAWSLAIDTQQNAVSATPLWNSKLPSSVTTITRGNGFLFLHSNTSPNVLVLDESAQTVSIGVALEPKDVLGHPMRSVWDSKHRTLIVLTSTAHLISYKVGFDGKMTQNSFRKLNTSTITDVNVLQLAFVSFGVVAVAAGDATIRIIAWSAPQQSTKSEENNNNNNEEEKQQQQKQHSSTSSLYFPDSAFGGATQQQVVVALGSSSRGRLCAGNRAGQVAIWQFVGNSETSLEDFQLLAHVGPPSSVAPNNNASSKSIIDNFAVDRVIMSNTTNGSALVLGLEYVQLLQGTVRQRKWHGRAMALQTAPSEVVVQNTSGNTFSVFPPAAPAAAAPADGKSSSSPSLPHVRGVDIFWPHVMLWTGKNAEVFSLTETTGAVTATASFEQTLPAVALYADGILLSRADKVQMTTLSKHANYTLSVSEAEGTPQVIHVAEDVGAFATNKGSLRVFKIGARDLKSVGPARQLRAPNGSAVANIGMMAVNRSGKKVAFTTTSITNVVSNNNSADENKTASTNQQSHHHGAPATTGFFNGHSLASSVFVHDVENDSVFEFCFGEDRVPSFFSWNMSVFNFNASTSTTSSSTSGADAESMLLAVETRIIKFTSSSSSSNNDTNNNENDNNEGAAALTLMNQTTQYLPSSFQVTAAHNNNNNHDASSSGQTMMSVGAGGGLGSSAPDRHITTLFSAPRGVYHHNTFPLHPQQSGLIGCAVPHLVIGIQLEAEEDDDEEFTTEKSLIPAGGGGKTGVKYDHSLFLKPLRDFDGMQQAENDAKLRTALMQFAYFAAIGNMDEAYKAVKLVKDPAIWVNMAKMCVSTKRIDVAEVCLSNMQDTVAARAVRESRDEEQLDVRIAVLATALGLVDDAERLLKKCKRYDLLTELYIACGRWDDAVANCEHHDRLRTTSVYFRHAQQAENAGLHDLALQLYDRAKCLGTESPRIFVSTNRVEELQSKIEETEDRDLLNWWAQYLESRNDIEGALAYYKRARDGFNVIRLLVSQKQIEAAEDFLRDVSLGAGNNNNNNNDKTSSSSAAKQQQQGGPLLSSVASSNNNTTSITSAAGAAFFIARHYESENNNAKAVQMYEQAAAYENAIRIAKNNDMHVDVLRISLKCGNNHTAMESGRYFEERDMYDRAVQLYRHGGDNQKAIDVCIKGGLFDDLHKISESLEQGADPETFIAMASHFEKSGHHNKAVEMMVFGKAFNEALQLCLDHNVKLTDAMAEAMTLPKSDNAEDEQYRLDLLRKIAKVAKDQESYHLACKKYTQAGDVMKGMKALLRSGDTEKIIFFANHIRNVEVYNATANFLQSTQWQRDNSIFKSIVTFYTKAKSYESLALFYDTAAQHQIDENRSYEKAAGLLREGQKALEKGGDTISPLKKEQLATRVNAVDTFVRATSLFKVGSDDKPSPQVQSEFVALCNDLLDRSRPPHPDAELIRSAVRIGDVGSTLAEFYASSEQKAKFEKAYQILEQMHADGIQLNLFVENSLLKKIADGAGESVAPFTEIPDKQFRRKSSVKPQKARPAEEDIAEEVDEDLE